MSIKWRNILINWINCIQSCEIKSLSELSNGHIICEIIKKIDSNANILTSNESAQAEILVAEFIKSRNPKFEWGYPIISGGYSALCIAVSLLLHYVCVQSKNVELKNDMCKTLSAEDQEVILQFNQTLMKDELTDETVKNAIYTCGGDELLECPDPTETENNAVTPSTPPTMRLLHERNRDIRNLQAALDTERFDRMYLQDALKKNEAKIVKLELECQQWSKEALRLKSLLEGAVCGSGDSDDRDTNQKNMSDRLLRQMQELEDRLVVSQTDAEQLKNQRDTFKAKLDEALAERDKWMKSAREECHRTGVLSEQLEELRQTVAGLQEVIAELSSHHRRNGDTSVCLEGDDIDTSLARYRLSADISAISEDLCTNVVEVQLCEEREASEQLRAQLATTLEQLERTTEETAACQLVGAQLEEKVGNLEEELLTMKHAMEDEEILLKKKIVELQNIFPHVTGQSETVPISLPIAATNITLQTEKDSKNNSNNIIRLTNELTAMYHSLVVYNEQLTQDKNLMIKHLENAVGQLESSLQICNRDRMTLVTGLELQISEFGNHADNLRIKCNARISSLESQISYLNQLVEAMFNHTKCTIKQKNLVISELENTICVALKQRDCLEKAFADSKSVSDTLISDLEESIKKISLELSTSRELIANNETLIEQKDTDIQLLNREKSNLELAFEKLKEEKIHVSEMCRRAEQTVLELNIELEEKKEIQKLLEERCESNAKIKSEEINKFECTLKTVSESHKAGVTSRLKLEEIVGKLEESTGKLEEELKEEKEKNEYLLRLYELTVDDKDSALKTLKDENVALKKAKTSLKKAKDNFEKKTDENNKLIRNARIIMQQKDYIESQNKELKAENAKLTENLSETKHKLEEIEKEPSQQEEIEKLSNERDKSLLEKNKALETMSKTLADTKQELEEAVKEGEVRMKDMNELQVKLDGMSEDLTSVIAEKTKLVHILENVAIVMQELRQKLAEEEISKTAVIKKMSDENVELKSKVEDKLNVEKEYEFLLNDFKVSLESGNNNLAVTNELLAESRLKLTEKDNTIIMLQDEIKEKADLMADLTNTIDDLMKKYDTITEANTIIVRELEKTVAKNKSDLNEIKMEKELVVEKNTSIIRDIEKLGIVIKELNSKLEEYLRQNETLVEANKNLEEKYNTSVAENLENRGFIKELEVKVETVETMIEEKAEECERMHDEINNIGNKYADSRHQFIEQAGDIDKYRMEVEELKCKINVLTEDSKMNKQHYEEILEEKNNFENKRDEFIATIQTVKADKQEYAARCEMLSMEKNDFENKCNIMSTELAAAESGCEMLVKIKNTEIAQLKDEIADTMLSKITIDNELKFTQTELEKLKMKINLLTAENLNLQSLLTEFIDKVVSFLEYLMNSSTTPTDDELSNAEDLVTAICQLEQDIRSWYPATGSGNELTNTTDEMKRTKLDAMLRNVTSEIMGMRQRMQAVEMQYKDVKYDNCIKVNKLHNKLLSMNLSLERRNNKILNVEETNDERQRQVADLNAQVELVQNDLTKTCEERNETISNLEAIICNKNIELSDLQREVTYLKTLMAESETKLLDRSKEQETLRSRYENIIGQKNAKIASMEKQFDKFGNNPKIIRNQTIKLSGKLQTIIQQYIIEEKSTSVLKETSNMIDKRSSVGNIVSSVSLNQLEHIIEVIHKRDRLLTEKLSLVQKEKDQLRKTLDNSASLSNDNKTKYFIDILSYLKTFDTVKNIYNLKLKKIISLQQIVKKGLLHKCRSSLSKVELNYLMQIEETFDVLLKFVHWIENCTQKGVCQQHMKDILKGNSPKLASDIQNIAFETQVEDLQRNFMRLAEDLRSGGENAPPVPARGQEPDDSQRKVMEVRAEYEDKLTRMKNKMKQLYQEEIDSRQEKLRGEVSKLEAELDKCKQELSTRTHAYEAHINSLTNELWAVGEKLLMEKNEADWLRRRQQSSSLMSLQHTSTAGLGHIKQPVERSGRPSTADTQSLRDYPADGRSKKEQRGLHMSDEEGEVFDNRWLEELESTPRAATGRRHTERRDTNRLSELKWRNSLCPPHLKSSYPAETQFQGSGFHDEDLKSEAAHGVAEKRGRKEIGIIAYKKPGPPTPSKNAGRLSATDSELRESLRHEPDGGQLHGRHRNTTPSRLKQLLFGNSRTDPESYSTPKTKRLSIFRKAR